MKKGGCDMELSEFLENKDKSYRVAAYIRVPYKDYTKAVYFQEDKEYLDEFIKNHPQWDFKGFYYDSNRDVFNKMVADCKEGLIDIIIAKSFYKFGKNIPDCLSIADKLLSLPVPVGIFFEKESIFTLSESGKAYIDFFLKIIEQRTRKSREYNESIFNLINNQTKRGDAEDGNSDK